jgi:hypothetical protein
MLPTATFAAASLFAAIAYLGLVSYLYSVSEVQALTAGQVGIAFVYGVIIALWCGAEAGFFVARTQPRYDSVEISEGEENEMEPAPSESTGLKESGKANGGGAGGPTIFFFKASHLTPLRYAAEFVAIMLFIYLTDRTTLVGKGPKYVRRAPPASPPERVRRSTLGVRTRANPPPLSPPPTPPQVRQPDCLLDDQRRHPRSGGLYAAGRARSGRRADGRACQATAAGPERGVEGVDADHVCAIPLLRRG